MGEKGDGRCRNCGRFGHFARSCTVAGGGKSGGGWGGGQSGADSGWNDGSKWNRNWNEVLDWKQWEPSAKSWENKAWPDAVESLERKRKTCDDEDATKTEAEDLRHHDNGADDTVMKVDVGDQVHTAEGVVFEAVDGDEKGTVKWRKVLRKVPADAAPAQHRQHREAEPAIPAKPAEPAPPGPEVGYFALPSRPPAPAQPAKPALVGPGPKSAKAKAKAVDEDEDVVGSSDSSGDEPEQPGQQQQQQQGQQGIVIRGSTVNISFGASADPHPQRRVKGMPGNKTVDRRLERARWKAVNRWLGRNDTSSMTDQERMGQVKSIGLRAMAEYRRKHGL